MVISVALTAAVLAALSSCASEADDSSASSPTQKRTAAVSAQTAGDSRAEASGPASQEAGNTALGGNVAYGVDALWPEDLVLVSGQVLNSDVIVVGAVTDILPARWNSPDGKEWRPEEDVALPVVYTTFMIEPQEVLKGPPKTGTPIAFRVPGGVVGSGAHVGDVDLGGDFPHLAVGDQVLVFGVDDQRFGPGAHYEPDGHWLLASAASVFRADGATYRRLTDAHLPEEDTVTPAEIRMTVRGLGAISPEGQ